MYDYPISPTLFHWQSMAVLTDSQPSVDFPQQPPGSSPIERRPSSSLAHLTGTTK